jgi:GntR family transcriptional regulator/MocR family aminotransferase
MDLSLLVEGSRHLSAQVYRQLREAILDGRLKTGEKLPSSRELALRLSISRNTVTAAYERLASEGYLDTSTGSGTYVSQSLAREPKRRVPDGAAVVPKLSDFAQRLTFPGPIVPRRDLPFDFRPGVPDLAHFPVDAWRRLTARQLRRLSKTLAYYGGPDGLPSLRQGIARAISHTRAVICTADDVIVTSGAQQALDLVTRVLVGCGDTVAVEDPGYPAALAVFRAMGARIAPVPVDRDGLVVDALPNEARVVYVTPSHQFPLGVPLSLARRRQLLAWAAQRNAAVIEDDYDSEFRYGGRPLDSLQGLDRTGAVIYLGTFSKVLFPGLRLGYIVAPGPLRPLLLAAKWITDRHTEAVEQHRMAGFIAEGHFARYLRSMQKIYSARHAALLRALERRTPWLKPLPSAAGLHLTALLPRRFPVEDFIVRCAATGVGLYSIAPFYQIPPARGGLMFGFGACELADIDEGIRRMANVHASMASLDQELRGADEAP